MASAVRALIDPVGGRCSAIRARCCRAGRVRPIQLAEGAATHVTIKASAVPNAVTILAWDCLTVRARRQCAGPIGQGTAVEFSATNITTPALTYACSHDTTRWLWLAKLAWRRVTPRISRDSPPCPAVQLYFRTEFAATKEARVTLAGRSAAALRCRYAVSIVTICLHTFGKSVREFIVRAAANVAGEAGAIGVVATSA